MTDIVAARKAVYAILEGAGLGVTLVGPNEDVTPDLPFVEVLASFANVLRTHVDGRSLYVGEVLVRVNVKRGTTETASAPIEKAILAALPPGTDLGNGAYIHQRPMIAGPLYAEGRYVVPISVQFRALL